MIEFRKYRIGCPFEGVSKEQPVASGAMADIRDGEHGDAGDYAASSISMLSTNNPSGHLNVGFTGPTTRFVAQGCNALLLSKEALIAVTEVVIEPYVSTF